MKYDSKGEVITQHSLLDQKAVPEKSSTTSAIMTPVKNAEVDTKDIGGVVIDRTPDQKQYQIISGNGDRGSGDRNKY